MGGDSGRQVWQAIEDEAMRDSVDERLAAALHDVPVPEGLAERLLARLAAAENELRTTKPRPVVAPQTTPRIATTGRGFLLSGGLLATAAVLFIAIWLGMHKSEGLSEQFVLDEAIRSFDLGVDQPGPLLSEKPAPADYPFSVAVLRVRGTRWRALEGVLFGGHRGVVYDLPGPAGASAALYVVDAEAVDGFGTEPALHPFTTAGCCASSWQEGGLLYVLVVQGDPATFRAYLNLPQGPVA
jgi:hypothetical protein